MIEFLKDIEKNDGICSGDPMYSLDEIKSVYQEVVEIANDNWLALHPSHPFGDNDKDLKNCSLSFALFRFSCSDADGKNIRVTTIFRGDGPTSSLRELRHIWWGPDGDGYVFYLPLKTTIAALTYLMEYFDDK